MTPLMHTTSLEGIRFLLESGAQVNKVDEFRRSALLCAVEKKVDVSVLELLI